MKQSVQDRKISYSYWLANLIAERDRIWNQISLIDDEVERDNEFARFRMTSLIMQMIREIEGILRSYEDFDEKVEFVRYGMNNTIKRSEK